MNCLGCGQHVTYPDGINLTYGTTHRDCLAVALKTNRAIKRERKTKRNKSRNALASAG